MRGVHDNRKIEEFFSKATKSTEPESSTPTTAGSSSKPELPTQKISNKELRPTKRVKRDVEDVERERVVEKRAKGGKARARGKLSFLPSLPLDILFEIFKLLAPTDILQLTRTTKALRATLLHRSATTVWLESVKQIDDFPKCPEDVSLPYWTSLIFDTFCHNCLARNTSSVNFILRIRCCNKCAKSLLVPLSRFPKESEYIHQGVPCDTWNDGYIMQALRSDVDAFLVKWKKRNDASVAKQLQNDRAEVSKRQKVGEEVKKWYEKRGDERAEEIQNIRTERAKAIKSKLFDLGFEAEFRFLTRFYSVCVVEQVPYGLTFYQHPLVKQAKPLTDRIWKNIEPEMVTLMNDMRDYMKQNERIKLQRARRKTIQKLYLEWRNQPSVLEKYPAHYMMPGPLDVLQEHYVKQLIELDSSVTDETFNTKADYVLQDRLPGIISVFRQNRHLYLTFQVNNYSPAIPGIADYRAMMYSGDSAAVPHAQLSLASVVFRCTSWDHSVVDNALARDHGLAMQQGGRWWRQGPAPEPLLWYPEFLTHPCCALSEHCGPARKRESNFSLGGLYDGREVYQREWNDKRLEFDVVASKTVLRILKACGLSTGTTVEELNEVDPRVVCLRCSFGAKCDGERSVRVWGWREAVHHSVSAHFGNSVVEWECLSAKDTAEAKRLEAIERVTENYPTASTEKVWRCTACRHTARDPGRMTLASMQRHFRAKPQHGDGEDMAGCLGVRYFRDPDATDRPHPRIKMIPGKKSEC